jgi:hypothetical protein
LTRLLPLLLPLPLRRDRNGREGKGRPEEVFGAEEELIRVDEQDGAEMREGQLGEVISLLFV